MKLAMKRIASHPGDLSGIQRLVWLPEKAADER